MKSLKFPKGMRQLWVKLVRNKSTQRCVYSEKFHASHQDFVGASNHFHTLVPKDYGVINNISAVDYCMKQLNDIDAVIYNLFDPDKFYEKLHCDIQPIDKMSTEFKLLKRCFDNTSIKQTHVLKITEVFTVTRHGEEARFEPFKYLTRHLLWHGSDIRNFAV